MTKQTPQMNNRRTNIDELQQSKSLGTVMFEDTFQLDVLQLIVILLNNLISHSYFWLSANQITSYIIFIQIHKLNDNQCRSWSDGFSEAIWSGSTLFAKVGVVMNSRIRVIMNYFSTDVADF